MIRRFPIFLILALAAAIGLSFEWTRAQQQDPQKKPEAGQKQQAEQAEQDDVIKVETALVVINVTVTDFEDKHVSGLKLDDFKLFEDAAPQKIQSLSFDEMPFASAILLDSSGSMERKLTFARAACASFIEGIRDDDFFSIYRFGGTKVKLLQDFTDVRDVPDSVWDMRADSLTPLYDAVVTASQALAKREERRRAIILVSDGGDSNSRASLDDAVKHATNAGVSIYAVDLTDSGVYKATGHNPGAEAMKSLTVKTGGKFYRTAGGAALKDAFASTVEELRRQYTIAYESTNEKQDGKWRKIDVRVARPGLSVRTRQGYYAKKKKG